MKPGRRQQLGRRGESIASAFLENKGYTILERNWRTPYGEIDIIARRDDAFVFVEVKTRASNTLGPPEISITSRKAEHMRSAAEYYIQQHPELTSDGRIDVISIQLPADNLPPIIEHFENVIT